MVVKKTAKTPEELTESFRCGEFSYKAGIFVRCASLQGCWLKKK
ncbi:hypothetical protein [Methanogenium marinum]|nr:hypothetical protein [Methanogenium marinum]